MNILSKKNLKRAGLVAVLLIIIGAVISGLSGSANAVDKNPDPTAGVVDHCISHAEWVASERSDKTRFEKSLGVYHDGRRVLTQRNGANIVVKYPWCGHPTEDNIQVAYYRNKAGYYMATYISEFNYSKMGG